MLGSIATQEKDEWQCQKKCLVTSGCSHFTFWKPGRLCHLQDALSKKVKKTSDFISGPFECWIYLLPGAFTQISSQTYVPEQFRCMQVGVMWQPTITEPMFIAGSRDQVVLKCQHQCAGMWGCAHFSVLFPNMCHLAGKWAVPTPSTPSTMSGPPIADCHEPGYIGHTFLKKTEVFSQEMRMGNTMTRVPAILFVASLVVLGSLVILARTKLQESQESRIGHRTLLLIASSTEVSPDE